MSVPIVEPAANEIHSSLLSRVKEDFAARPFIPHPLFQSGDAQTIVAHFWPGRFRPRDLTQDEERLFEVEPGVRVLARCRWQRNRKESATLAIWHGMEGSTASAYMLSTADKAFRAGCNVIRVNYRTCGGTEQLTDTIYHGGLTTDLRAVITELRERDRLSQLFIAGFSLGGNMVLKLAGEYGDDPPPEIKGLAVVSASIDMRASLNLLMKPRNWIYQRNFLGRLKDRIKLKASLFPDRYDVTGIEEIRTIEQFDDRYVAPAFGFADANDYYAKASSLPHLKRIRIPTLIIHAKDDPFIPFEPLRDYELASNPNVLLIGTERGGHVAFIARKTGTEDRFWAENRLVEFCGIIVDSTHPRGSLVTSS